MKLKMAKIESCQNWKLAKLKIAIIENCQNWKLPNQKLLSCEIAKMKVSKVAKIENG